MWGSPRQTGDGEVFIAADVRLRAARVRVFRARVWPPQRPAARPDMGYRDHTTILHGSRAVQSLIDSGDSGTIAAIAQIIERLTGKTH